MNTPKPCGTRSAYRRHKNNKETPCEPCTLANRAHAEELRRKQGIQPRTNSGITELIDEVLFLLNAGEGEHRILDATGYNGRPTTLRSRLTQAGHHDLAARIFNGWELAA